jgi:hypothetical protein
MSLPFIDEESEFQEAPVIWNSVPVLSLSSPRPLVLQVELTLGPSPQADPVLAGRPILQV